MFAQQCLPHRLNFWLNRAASELRHTNAGQTSQQGSDVLLQAVVFAAIRVIYTRAWPALYCWQVSNAALQESHYIMTLWHASGEVYKLRDTLAELTDDCVLLNEAIYSLCDSLHHSGENISVFKVKGCQWVSHSPSVDHIRPVRQQSPPLFYCPRRRGLMGNMSAPPPPALITHTLLIISQSTINRGGRSPEGDAMLWSWVEGDQGSVLADRVQWICRSCVQRAAKSEEASI